MALTENLHHVCRDCGEEYDHIKTKCPACGSEDSALVDTRPTCAICGEKTPIEDGEEEELYKCDRCNKEVCYKCTYDDYPYNVTYCQECGDEWKHIMEENNFDC